MTAKMHPVEGEDGPALVSVRIGRTPVSVVAGDDDALFLGWGELPTTAPFSGDQGSGTYGPEEEAVLRDVYRWAPQP